MGTRQPAVRARPILPPSSRESASPGPPGRARLRSSQPLPRESRAAAGPPPAPPPALTGRGLRSEGRRRQGGAAGPAGEDRSRAQPRARSALPAAAPRLLSAHPRPLQCPGSFSRRPAGRPSLFGVGLSPVRSARSESSPSQGSCAVARGPCEEGGWMGGCVDGWMDGWMDGSRAACRHPTRASRRSPCPPSRPLVGRETPQGTGGSWPWECAGTLRTSPCDHKEPPLPPRFPPDPRTQGRPHRSPAPLRVLWAVRQLSISWALGVKVSSWTGEKSKSRHSPSVPPWPRAGAKLPELDPTGGA